MPKSQDLKPQRRQAERLSETEPWSPLGPPKVGTPAITLAGKLCQ